MKILISILFAVAIVINGCGLQDLEEPTSPVQMQKTSNDRNGILPYMQELEIVGCNWQVEGTDIEVEILNQNLFNITDDYFAVIEYGTNSLMIYLNKPVKPSFTIPYLGTNTIQSVRLFAIIHYIHQ